MIYIYIYMIYIYMMAQCLVVRPSPEMVLFVPFFAYVSYKYRFNTNI